MDTIWEEAEADILQGQEDTMSNTVKDVLKDLKDKGWKLVYPVNRLDLCPGCRNYIEEGTYHVTFNGNPCEIVKRPPRGMVPRKIVYDRYI